MMNQKYILHSVAVLAVAALATACSSEDELTDKTSGNKETVNITAYQPSTRVGFDSNGDGYWQEGDKIGVWSTGESKFSTFTIVSEDVGKASATFSGTVTDGIGKYAVYPFNVRHSLSENTLTYYLPSSYTYTSVDQTFFPEGKNGNSFRMPMYGIVSDDNTVSFKHLGGVICLKIDKMPAESGTVKVTEASNQLCGTFTATLTDDAPEIKTTQATSNNSVKFTYSGATADATGVFYLPVAIGTYNLTIQVYDGSKVSTTNATVGIERSTLKVMNIKTDYTDRSKTVDGHKFIDLGLPSGLLWAETNIGAETAYDDGNYYAWGETSPKEASEEYLKIDDYVYYDASTSSYTKYNSTDSKEVLEAADDAAYVNWGSFCRMPTYCEFKELINSNNCTWTWDSGKNSAGETINYYKVVSKKNNKFIYLPASGLRTGGSLNVDRSHGGYWSSTLDNDNNDVSCAYYLDFGKNGYGINYSYVRYYGVPVRPVAKP